MDLVMDLGNHSQKAVYSDFTAAQIYQDIDFLRILFLPSPCGQSAAVLLDPVEQAFESGRSGLLVLPGQLSQVFEAVGDGELAS
jgi:hypothetical protein